MHGAFIRLRHKLHRLLHYEYWPVNVLYAPLLPLLLYYAFKSKNLFYFIASNPGIRNGGFVNDSKFEVLSQLPKKYIPYTTLLQGREQKDKFTSSSFPIIVKPDIGLRGLGVDLVKNPDQLKKALDVPYDILVQEYIDYHLEFGVFYSCNPETMTPKITGVTGKQFLSISGDGIHSFGELLNRNPRIGKNRDRFKNEYQSQWNRILNKGEHITIENIGNHNRGTLFYDASHLIDERMIHLFQKIAENIQGFYWGRFDVRVKTESDLYTGDHLKIIEVNGSQSEPTHLYDPRYSIFRAYRVLFQHCKLNYLLTHTLVQKNLSEYPRPKQFIEELKKHFHHRSEIKQTKNRTKWANS